jgi:hypothetical protein
VNTAHHSERGQVREPERRSTGTSHAYGAGAIMMTTQPDAMRRLDELVIEALSIQQPPARPSDSYVTIEIVPDDSDDDVAITHRFVRAAALSTPYERIELSSSSVSIRRARPTTFVRTVRATPPQPAATLSFDKQWFEQSDDVIAATEDNTPIARATSWLWLGISLLAAAFAVGIVQYAI